MTETGSASRPQYSPTEIVVFIVVLMAVSGLAEAATALTQFEWWTGWLLGAVVGAPVAWGAMLYVRSHARPGDAESPRERSRTAWLVGWGLTAAAILSALMLALAWLVSGIAAILAPLVLAIPMLIGGAMLVWRHRS